MKKGFRHLIKRRVSKSNPTSPEKGGKVSIEEIDMIVRDAGFDWSSSQSLSKRQRVEGEPGQSQELPSQSRKSLDFGSDDMN